MNQTTKEAVLSALRLLVLTPAATWLIAHGYAGGQSIETLVGAMVVLLVAAWGVWDKYMAERKTVKRELTAVHATIEAVKTLNGDLLNNPPVTSQQTQQLIKTFSDRANGMGFDNQSLQKKE